MAAIYVARPALESKTAGFEVLGGLLELFTRAVEASAGAERMTTQERMLLRLLPDQFLATTANRTPNPMSASPGSRFRRRDDRFPAVDLYRKLKGIDLPSD